MPQGKNETDAQFRKRMSRMSLMRTPLQRRGGPAPGKGGGYRPGSGRKPDEDRCPCGENKLSRAEARAFDCCKAKGLMPRGPAIFKSKKKAVKKAAKKKGAKGK